MMTKRAVICLSDYTARAAAFLARLRSAGSIAA
jgi:hypothetical protein